MAVALRHLLAPDVDANGKFFVVVGPGFRENVVRGSNALLLLRFFLEKTLRIQPEILGKDAVHARDEMCRNKVPRAPVALVKIKCANYRLVGVGKDDLPRAPLIFCLPAREQEMLVHTELLRHSTDSHCINKCGTVCSQCPLVLFWVATVEIVGYRLLQQSPISKSHADPRFKGRKVRAHGFASIILMPLVIMGMMSS